jgi:hypothetical protein
VGGLILAVLLFGKKAKADPAPGPRTDDGRAEPTPEPDPKAPIVIKLPSGPGSSPLLAVLRGEVWPGFDGYVRVFTGDTLIKIAKAASKLDGQPIAWRSLRDDPENAWCKNQTPAAHLELYGLELVPSYGKEVGVDCEVVPGWRARRHNHGTGTLPVLRVRQP